MSNGDTSPQWGAYAKPGSYTTPLAPQEEAQFEQWVKTNKIPWQDSPTSDYDMRGYWKAQQAGNQRAKTEINPLDKKPHYPDTWKTPYHKTFSRESQYALPTAGHWEGQTFVPPEKNEQQFTPQEFAAKIKAKYPVYADIPDDQLVDKITAKYPQYKTSIKLTPESQRPDAVKQARGTPQFPPAKDVLSRMMFTTPKIQKYAGMGEEKEIAVGAPPAAKTLLEMGGGGLGAGAVKAGGVLGLIGRALASGAGAGTGNIAGQLATTGKVDPAESLRTGGEYALGQGLFSPMETMIPTKVPGGRSATGQMLPWVTKQVPGPGKSVVGKAGGAIVGGAKGILEWTKANPGKAALLELVARELGVDPIQLAGKVLKYGKSAVP
jgi:hypothetical protein